MRIIFFIFCCSWLVSCKPPAFSIVRKDVVVSPIKMQGVYYNKPDFYNFILYKNGVLLDNMGRPLHQDIKEIANNLLQYNSTGLYIIDLGVFEIKGKQINIERWYGCSDYCIAKYSGEILNDTTLLLNHPVVGRDTFHFHYMPIKPDSTNKFIK